MKPESPAKTAPPRWWSPSAGVWIAIGFAAFATIPYLASATKLMADGRPVTVEGMKKEAEKGMKKYEEPEKLREVKAIAAGPDGRVWAGGKAGLFTREGDDWKAVTDYPGHEVKSLAIASDGTVIAVEEHGVYELGKDGKWNNTHEGDAHAISLASDGAAYLAMKKSGGILRRAPDGKWERWSDGLPVSEEQIAAMKKHEHEKDEEHGKEKDHKEDKP
jgi:hypothetical protein